MGMEFFTGMMFGQANGNNAANREFQDHLGTIGVLKKWRQYAINLRASLDAERMAEADVIAELARVDPTNPLANQEAVDALGDKYYKLIDNKELVARAEKKAAETKTD